MVRQVVLNMELKVELIKLDERVDSGQDFIWILFFYSFLNNIVW